MAIASMRRDALAFFDRAASARSSTDVRSVRVIDNATIPHPMSRLSKHRLMTGWIRERAYESHPRAAGISGRLRTGILLLGCFTWALGNGFRHVADKVGKKLFEAEFRLGFHNATDLLRVLTIVNKSNVATASSKLPRTAATAFKPSACICVICGSILPLPTRAPSFERR
jgi:hypothetical protein